MKSTFRSFCMSFLSVLMISYLAGSLCLPLMAVKCGAMKTIWTDAGTSSEQEEDTDDTEDNLLLYCECNSGDALLLLSERKHLYLCLNNLQPLLAEVSLPPPEYSRC